MYMYKSKGTHVYSRGSQSLQNLVALSLRYCQMLLILKAGWNGNNGNNGYSFQGLVAKVKDIVANGLCVGREPLVMVG